MKPIQLSLTADVEQRVPDPLILGVLIGAIAAILGVLIGLYVFKLI